MNVPGKISEVFSDSTVKWILAFSLGILILLHKGGAASGSASVTPGIQYILTLALCVVAFYRPAWGIAIVILSLPVIMVFPPVPRQTFAIYLFVGATTLGYVRLRFAGQINAPFRLTIPHICGMFFVLWLLATNLLSPFSSYTYMRLVTYLMLLTLMLLAPQLLRHSNQIEPIMKLFIGLAILSGVVGIFEARIGGHSYTSLRGEGFTGHPNTLAMVSVLAMAFVLHFLSRTKEKRNYITLLILLAILFASLASTVSRTSLLIGILLIIGYTLARFRTGIMKPYFLIPIAVVCLGLIPFGYWKQASGIFHSIVYGLDSAGFRYMQWEAGLLMWWDHFWTGVGLENFQQHLPQYSAHIVPFYGIGYQPHSMIVGLLAETGIVGFLLFTTTCVTSLLAYIHDMRGLRDPSGISLPLFAATIIILLNGLTGDWQLLPLLWILLGLAPGKTLFEWKPGSARSSRPKEHPVEVTPAGK